MRLPVHDPLPETRHVPVPVRRQRGADAPHAEEPVCRDRQGRGALRGAQDRPERLPGLAPVSRHAAKGAAARLAGIEIPKFEDNEKTFPELHARIDKTIAFLDTLSEGQFADAATRDVVLQLRDRKLEFKGADYLTTWALPNFFFHVTTAYALLRHGGVEIGKRDYMAGGDAH